MADIHGSVTVRKNLEGQIETKSIQGVVEIPEENIQPSVEVKDIHGDVNVQEKIGGKIRSTSTLSGAIDSSVKNRLNRDYNPLINHPHINNIELIGNRTLQELGITVVYTNTTEYWNSQIGMIGEKDAFYVYTDHSQDEEGNNIPGIKIGDGQAYLIDTPFLDANFNSHISNTEIHITQAERDFWNSKTNNIYCDTTEYWNSHPELQSEKDAIYVYTDHQQMDDKDIPGIKIGDGNAFVIDLPFIDDVYAAHIANSIIHVTQEDKDIWNNNVTCFIDPIKGDKLVFRKRQI